MNSAWTRYSDCHARAILRVATLSCRSRIQQRWGNAFPRLGSCTSRGRARDRRRRRGNPSSEAPLDPESDGYFSLELSGNAARHAATVFGSVAEGACFPDPASRFQPLGPHGPSQVVDPSAFEWTDESWRGVTHRTAGAVRDARRHLHARKAPGLPRSSICRRWPTSGSPPSR